MEVIDEQLSITYIEFQIGVPWNLIFCMVCQLSKQYTRLLPLLKLTKEKNLN